MLDTQEIIDRLPARLLALEGAVDGLQQSPTEDQFEKSEILGHFDNFTAEIDYPLRKVLGEWLANPELAMDYSRKTAFRRAGLYSLISLGECKRWMTYCNGADRNSILFATATNVSENEILAFAPEFIVDARKMVKILEQEANDIEI